MFSGVNKLNQLPAIDIDEFILCQSLPIMEYLEERFPDQGVKLLPKSPRDRAIVRQMSEVFQIKLLYRLMLDKQNKLEQIYVSCLV